MRRLCLASALGAVAASCIPVSWAANISINAGGPATTGYVSDRYYISGSPYTYAASIPGVYKTERWSYTSFRYDIPVAPGQVEVTLRLRESCTMCNYTRTFSVRAEGQTIYPSVTIPLNQVADRTFTITSDSTLNLVFTKVSGEAYVSAIEVRELASSPSPAPTLAFSANPSSVSAGGSATLSWSSTGATSCIASGSWNGSKALSGPEVQTNLLANKIYTLNCTGAGGTIQRSVNVTVTPASPGPPTISLSANPSTVPPGGTSTLSWSTSNATQCQASNGWSGAKALSGSTSVGPLSATTTFTLSCTGTGGATSSSTGVTVLSQPPSGAVFPLRAESGKRYLVSASGEPFIIRGDAGWSMIVQLTNEQVDQYLDDRKAKGFNTIVTELIESYYATNAPRNVYGDAPFLTAGDFSTPNEAYFAHAAVVLQKALDRNMLVLLAPAYLGYGAGSDGWYNEMLRAGTTKLKNYGAYVANRLASYPNVLWLNGGDYNPSDLTVVRAVIDGIKSVDATRLHTYHTSRGYVVSSYVGSQTTWLDVDNIYTHEYDVGTLAAQQAANNGKPTFLLEARYENDDVHLHEAGLRTQAFQAMLSGQKGYMVGNATVWPFATGWQTALQSTMYRSFQHVNALFASKQSARLLASTGSGKLLGSAGGNGLSAAAGALADNGSFAIVYTPSIRALAVDLSKLAGPNVLARWYDPTRGTYSAAGTFPASGVRSFTPPSSNGNGYGDWVLLLEAQ